MKGSNEYPTLKELERYILERGPRYGLTDLERRIRRRDSVADFIGVYGGRTVTVVIKVILDANLMESVKAYQRRTGDPVHVFVLDRSGILDGSTPSDLHLIDQDDLQKWLAVQRSRKEVGGVKGALSPELRKVVSYLERREISIVGPGVVTEYLEAETDEEFMSEKDARKRANDIIRRLSKKNWLELLTRSRYLLIPLRSQETYWSEDPLIVASNIVSPSYVSYGTALNFHGLTEQVMFHIDVATRKRHAPFEFQKITYNFVTIEEHKFFGYEEEGKGPQPVVMAEPEKAVIDVLDRMPYFSDVADPVTALLYGEASLDPDKLVDYSLRMGSGVLCRRLGYLLDCFKELDILPSVRDDHIDRLRSSIGDYWSYTALSTRAPEEGKRVKRWRVIDNIDVPVDIESRMVL